VHYLPGGLHTYVRGRVVMIGDAAHAALPTVGGGASTALEDGVWVGRLIAAPVSTGADLGTALAAFDQARRPGAGRSASCLKWLWVPKTYATRRYSWMTPPARSCRRTWK
jgi:2-polyprenyl-6-methoxyphenol hydroxylase-like FAD-dependent oxidoreductase